MQLFGHGLAAGVYDGCMPLLYLPVIDSSDTSDKTVKTTSRDEEIKTCSLG